jgi:hypothetical protein
MATKTNVRTEELYGGDIKINFYPDSHRYKLDGEKTYLISATGCTGIIDKSQVLIIWALNLAKGFINTHLENSKENRFTKEELGPIIEEAMKQHTIKKETAADIGSQTHDWCERFAKAQINKTEIPEIPEAPEITENSTDEEKKKADDMEKVQNGIMGFLEWFNSRKVVFEASERLLYSKIHGVVGITDFIARINGFRVLGDFKTSKGVYDEQYLQLSGYMGMAEEEEKYIEKEKKGQKRKNLKQALFFTLIKKPGSSHITKCREMNTLLIMPLFLTLLG